MPAQSKANPFEGFIQPFVTEAKLRDAFLKGLFFNDFPHSLRQEPVLPAKFTPTLNFGWSKLLIRQEDSVVRDTFAILD